MRAARYCVRSLLLTIHIRPMVQMTPTTAAGQSSPHTAARASAPGTNHADHNQDTVRILGRLLVQFLAQGPGVGKQPEGMRSLIPAGKSSKFGSPFLPVALTEPVNLIEALLTGI